LTPQLSSFGNEVELTDLREAIQQLLRWAWKYNRNLEEQAAQLHMLTGWSQTVEVDRFVFSSRFLTYIFSCLNMDSLAATSCLFFL